MLQYFLLWLSTMGGILIYSGIKIDGINRRTPTTVSIGEIIKLYLRMDFARIFVSILTATILLIGICNWLGLKAKGDHLDLPFVSGEYEQTIIIFIHGCVAGMGFISGSFAMKFGAKAEQYISEKTTLDEKVKDVLDSKNNTPIQ
jgi:hypothetical protein